MFSRRPVVFGLGGELRGQCRQGSRPTSLDGRLCIAGHLGRQAAITYPPSVTPQDVQTRQSGCHG
jgi:hypothetical protein